MHNFWGRFVVSDSDLEGSGVPPENPAPPSSPVEPEVIQIVEPQPSPEPVVTPTFSVGFTLKEVRERRSLDLAGVATKLRIRQPFLVALEEGRFKDLPGGTYAIGFLRTYAEFLGLDGEEMVRRFRQEAADALTVHAELQFPSPVSEGRLPSAPVLLMGLAVAIVAYGLWWGVIYSRDTVAELIPAVPERLSNLLKRPAGMGAPATPVAEPSAADTAANPVPAEDGAPKALPEGVPVQPDLKAGADVVPPSEDDGGKSPATPPASPVAAAPMALPAPAAAAPSADGQPAQDAAAASGRVVIRAASDDSWIQVRESDGQLVVSRLLHQGDSYTVPDRSGLTLTTGNAGTLQILLDGKALPPLGAKKEVKHNVSLDPAKLQKRLKPDAPVTTPDANAAPATDSPAPASDAKPKKKDAAKQKDKDKDKPKPVPAAADPAPAPAAAPAPADAPPPPAQNQ